MEASKVVISKDTLALNTGRKRRELREALIIEYIKSKPYGTPIGLLEVANLLNMKHSSDAYAILKSMMLQHKIMKENVPGRRGSTYTVMEEVRVTQPHVAPRPSFNAVEAMAKEFAWTENSNDLRAFIVWAKNRAFDSLKQTGGGSN